MDQFIKKHAQYIAQKGYSDKTVEEYTRYIIYFYHWIKDRSKKIHPKDVTKDDIYDFQSHLFDYKTRRGDHLTLSTQGKRLRALKSFFRFLSKRNLILFDPTTGLDMPKEEKNIPRDILTKSEVRKLLNRPDTTTLLGLRDRAILELFYSTGIRRNELLGIRLIDLDIERGILRVKGKFKKERIVPVGNIARKYLLSYIENVRPKLLRDKRITYLFLSNRGMPLESSIFSPIIQRYVKEAGIRKRNISCHALRHCCATHMLEEGADIRYIQELLGHKSLETTQLYTKVAIKGLRKVHRKYHPREKDYRREFTPQGAYYRRKLWKNNKKYIDFLNKESNIKTTPK
ncbi:MAG: tyrosine-type recombinase/integrase [Candidatus Omnitrophica bacterium]|nr:tyrosine-type recombinase/integrase [Candidatus Omnitrophota bacterium]